MTEIYNIRNKECQKYLMRILPSILEHRYHQRGCQMDHIMKSFKKITTGSGVRGHSLHEYSFVLLIINSRIISICLPAGTIIAKTKPYFYIHALLLKIVTSVVLEEVAFCHTLNLESIINFTSIKKRIFENPWKKIRD